MYLKWGELHSLSFIRDGANFCLGLSLIFSSISPSPVPYSPLIFQVNLDRLLLGRASKLLYRSRKLRILEVYQKIAFNL